MKDRPNFLLIMTDQQRGDALGIEGHSALMTPNMDHIAGSGVRFSRAYASCPTCMPARRTILSGQYPSNHGLLRNHPGLEWPDAPPTMPGVLRDAGYHTYFAGRSMHQYPQARRFGFDHKLEHPAYFDWLRKQVPSGGDDYYATGIMQNDWTAHPWHLEEHLHFTNWIVDQGLQFLKHQRDPNCPFFLMVSFIAPHPPFNPPSFYMDRYLRMEMPPPVIGEWAEPPQNGGLGDPVDAIRVNLTGEQLRSSQAGYYGLINHIDDQIRRLLHPLGGLPPSLAENTVVIFFSDHGEMLGDHYRFRKNLPYDGAARIPFLVQAPNRFEIEARQVIDQVVGQEDLMPTVLDMAGLDIPETVDGRSLLPLMRGEQVEWREFLHMEGAPHPRDLIGGFHSLTDGKEKYIWYAGDGKEQFFDLEQDPNECHDLAADGSSQVNRWRQCLIETLKNRPEGFTNGQRLIPARPYPTVLPHALPQEKKP